MDKETLSNYGWIVICVLVMVVMIAFATPFGSFISGAVQSTTKGLFDVNKSALNSTGLIDIDDQTFDVPDMNHGAGENGGTPVLNEYGFYYDVIYVAVSHVDCNDEDINNMAISISEDGALTLYDRRYGDGTWQSYSTEAGCLTITAEKVLTQSDIFFKFTDNGETATWYENGGSVEGKYQTLTMKPVDKLPE